MRLPLTSNFQCSELLWCPQNIVTTCAFQKYSISLTVSAVGDVLASVVVFQWQRFMVVIKGVLCE